MICDLAGLLVTAKLIAVSSRTVQKHTPWNRKARTCGVWCEAFAPQTAKYHGETPPFVPLSALNCQIVTTELVGEIFLAFPLWKTIKLVSFELVGEVFLVLPL